MDICDRASVSSFSYTAAVPQQTTRERRCKGRKVYFVSPFEGAAQHGGEEMGTGVCSRWSHRVLGQEAERDEACVSSTPSFVFSLTSQSKGR